MSLNLIKMIYSKIFKVDTEFEMIFMSYMLYINFKYEDIFSDPPILELMARNTDVIDKQLRLNPSLTRRQLESMFLALHVFLYLSLINGESNQLNGESNQLNGESNQVNGESDLD